MHGLLATALFLLALPAAAPARTARLIELRGHARILALDEPVLKGRVFLFHRYPDGVFVSVPAAEVLGIATTTIAAEKTEKARFLAGETILLGPTGEGPSEQRKPSGAEEQILPPYSDYPDFFYSSIGCCSAPQPARPERPLAPALVGPNGYPGTPTREIGPNGFPVLAPSPVPREIRR